MTINELKTKVATQKEKGFVGRHQHIVFIKEMLAENVSNLDLDKAYNLDATERNFILDEFNYVKNAFAQSTSAENYRDSVGQIVLKFSEDLTRIINQGYLNCVLENDKSLANDLFGALSKLYKFARENGYSKAEAVSEEKYRETSIALASRGALQYLDLGELLNSSNLNNYGQSAWMVFLGLVLEKENFFSGVFSVIQEKDFQIVVKNLNDLLYKLLEENSITREDRDYLEKLIKKGIETREERKNKI